MGQASRFNITSFTIITALCISLVLPLHGPLAQKILMPFGELVDAEARISLSIFHPGAEGYIAITAAISDGWHINSHQPLESYLIPTVLEIKAPDGIEIVRILYPEPALEKLDISDSKMSLYHGEVTFGGLLRIGDDVAPGTYRMTATLRYQGCNNLTCLEPSRTTAVATLRVGSLNEATETLHHELFSQPPFVDEEGKPITAKPVEADKAEIGGIIANRGLFFALLLIFLGGLALNLTPCIYPLIPITISYFGGQAGGRTSRIFFLALLYVLGMSLTYSILGTIAATTGELFGSAMQNPWVVGFIAAVLVGLATSMFGLWELRLPMFVARGTGTAKSGYLGALFMGLTVGIVAAPCIGPFVLGLLTYVGEKGQPLLGFLMFFTLAWGIGIPFLVLGMISGSISRLPRSGNWMIWVRKIFGFVLIAMALYFARHLIGSRLSALGYSLTALAAGIYLGWLDRTAESGRGFSVIRRVVGVVGVATAIAIIALPGGPFRAATEKPGIEWIPFSEESLVEAVENEKPVMIDFTADWCIPCHELDHKSFTDPTVIELSKSLLPLKVDLTKHGDREKKIKKDYKIFGVPTIIFIDQSGNEMTNLRITGFVGPEEIRKRMQRLIR